MRREDFVSPERLFYRLVCLMMALGVMVVLHGKCPGADGTAQGVLPVRSNPINGPIGTPIGGPIDLDGNPNLEGIAFDDKSSRLCVLNDVDNDTDGDGVAEAGEEIQIYAHESTPPALTLVSSFAIPAASNTGRILTDGRGLALAGDVGRQVLYTLSSRRKGTKDANGKDNFDSSLWRVDFTEPAHPKVQTVDLNRPVFDLRGAEVFDLACDKRGRIYISFDASKQAANLNDQRSRGILRFEVRGDGPWSQAVAGSRNLVKKILPGSGKTLRHHAFGLTMMDMDGHEYLIATIEELTSNRDQEIYAAETETGRGFFKFNAPQMTGNLNTERRLAYGAGVLWVAEQREGLDQVQRVVIKDNVYEPLVGYKRPRRIQFTMISRALGSKGEDCGKIIHSCGHPLESEILPSQGSYLAGHVVRKESPPPKPVSDQVGSEQLLSYLPMNDPSSRGRVTRVCYSTAASQHNVFKTVFEEDFWTREYRHFVYPHLASNSLGKLRDTDFRLGHLKKGDPAIPDSLPRFHWTHQEQIFEDFIDRAKAYIVEKYGVEADLTNPYWAARNISEYIRDNYNYPAPPASEDGSGDSRGNFVDYEHFHVANGPAVYKMIMTDPRFKIGIHNRRSGCMAAGGMFLAVMRYMGYPARWIGTSLQKLPAKDHIDDTDIFHDSNGDGMFNADDYMKYIIHGHYTNEVYLGPGYGWQRFDATPKKPDDRECDGLDYDDFAHLHSRDSQYELMKRRVTPGQNPCAVASSIGVGYNEHFFRNDRENRADCAKSSIYHEATGVYTSACKGEQGYDFVVIRERPSMVGGRHGLRWLPCLTFDVVLNGGKPTIGTNTVEFTPRGPWALFEPDARVEIVLRFEDGGKIAHKVLKTDVAWDKGRETVTIPEDAQGKSIHLQVRKIGPEKFIGGASPKFSLP
ncbi:MAG: transglutaminase domain-containing protein [Pirellulales bacterium]|nr:transglutaminase domain-containing protein [Pirellulales bacterium]